MRSLLVRCYPARWRARYGDEFEAILDERPLGPFDVADVLLGALDARLRMRGREAGSPHRRGFDMSLRVGGIAAIIGATLFGIAGVLLLGLVPTADTTLPATITIAGLAFLLVALAGLSAFQARTEPHLAWAAFLVPAFGTLAIIVSVIAGRALDTNGDGSFAGDAVVGLLLAMGALTAYVGSALFGITTYRSGVLSRRGASLLVAAPAIAFLAVLSMSSWDTMTLLFCLATVAFISGWYWLGIQAIRHHPPSTEPRTT